MTSAYPGLRELNAQVISTMAACHALRRITTRLGFEIEVTPDHPLLRLQPDGTTAWQQADTLQPGDFVAIQRGQGMFGQNAAIQFTYQPNGHTDHAKPITVNTLDEDLGYLLGLPTGDGCLTFPNRVILSSADEEILSFFSRMAAHGLASIVLKNGAGRSYDRVIASAQLYQLLLYLGMSNGRAATKRVPWLVLRAPRAIVAAYLQGLFDTHGRVIIAVGIQCYVLCRKSWSITSKRCC